jgi:hypothetical protein
LAWLLCLVLAVPVAHADEPNKHDDKQEKGEDKKEKGEKKKDKKDKDGQLGNLEIGGRVLVRETISSENGADYFGRLELASVRLELDYRRKNVRAVLELDADGGNAKLKDGYLKLSLPERFAVRGGQFKLPVSSIENEGVLTLPSIGRGMLTDVLGDSLLLTGRRRGAEGLWNPKGDVAPVVQLGVYQSIGELGDPEPGTVDDGLGLDVFARGGIEWKRGDCLQLDAGLSGAWRRIHPGPGEPAERYWGAGLDARFDWRVPPGGLRAWAEVTFGTQPYGRIDDAHAVPIFYALRGLAAWRFSGHDEGDWYVEPYALASFMDPNVDNGQDLIWELSAGVGVGRWERWRVQLQWESWRESGLTPMQLMAGGLSLTDRDALLVQLGAGF